MTNYNINKLKALSIETQMNWAFSEAIILKLNFFYIEKD
jgi:hypothetical protein